MFRMVIHWLLSAIALMLVSKLVQGYYVNDMQSVLIAAVAIGFINALMGFLLRLINFPLAIIMFGLFLVVINASIILLASKAVDGFYVSGWEPAVWGAAVLATIGLLIRFLMKEE